MFYYKDFLADMQDHPTEIVGAWILLLINIWHKKSNGNVTRDIFTLSRIMNANISDAERYIDYIDSEGIADVSRHNGEITIVCRRVKRDSKLLEQNRLRQQRYRDREPGNEEVTREKRGNNAPNNAHVTAKKHPPSTSTSVSSLKLLKFKQNILLRSLKKGHSRCYLWFLDKFETKTKRDKGTLERYAKLCTAMMERDKNFNYWLTEAIDDIVSKNVGYPGPNKMFIKAVNNKIGKTVIN